MALEYKSGFCKSCKEQKMVQRKKPNHILHLLLTLLTGGLWLIIWILVSVQFGGWRCQTCGSSKIKGVK